ncbi:hypothetical protein [Devosia sp.]|uniref:hypothetical protein n=1 Tax=Devosia sp. TaxID=1871048 RepID=UPI002AFEA114|nr:hypothetical protein [Devosia sp.]
MINWTPELDDKIRQMRADGYGATPIAREIGTTRNAILGRFFRLDRADTAPPRVELSLDDRVVAKFNSGMSCERIAMNMRMSRKTVRSIVAAHGLNPSAVPNPDGDIDDIWEMDEDERRAAFARAASENARKTRLSPSPQKASA